MDVYSYNIRIFIHYVLSTDRSNEQASYTTVLEKSGFGTGKYYLFHSILLLKYLNAKRNTGF